MTPRQIAVIQDNWRHVLPIQVRTASLFYHRLFELDPTLRPLFRADIVAQGRKLMAMIDTVVGDLPQLERVLPEVRALGQRHVDYGVQPMQYATVGEALLWALSVGLGPAFTDEARAAWGEAYATLASVMIEAAAQD